MKEQKLLIYNVMIAGVSIGMTFNRLEAEDWKRSSMYSGDKRVVAVHYTEERDKYRNWVCH